VILDPRSWILDRKVLITSSIPACHASCSVATAANERLAQKQRFSA
jgi:hypothetical protein